MTNGETSTPELREEATRIAARLRRGGFEALFAGGCVRDRLLGIEPREYDIATSATPREVKSLFPRSIGVGEAFGVMLIRRGGATFEVATFRCDGTYLDGRHPTEVRFAGAAEDARRRDFTINGLFERPESGEVIDFVGGRSDLEARVLRAIGDPAARLAEDRLRALRAVRFAARFGLAVEPETEAAILALGGRLDGVSRERFGQELRRMFAVGDRVVAAKLLERWGLDRVLLGGHRVMGRHPRLAALPASEGPMTALAAWILDRDRGSDPLAVAAEVRDLLSLSNAEAEALRSAIELEGRLRSDWPNLATPPRRRLAMDPHFEAALAVLGGGEPVAAEEIRAWISQFGPDRNPERLVRGRDLLDLGVPAGPALGGALEAVYDAQLEGGIASREAGLEFAKRWLEARSREVRATSPVNPLDSPPGG